MSQPGNGGRSVESAQPSSWRGRVGARAKAVRHRWQKDWSAQPLEHLQTREHWRRIRTVGLLLAALLLTAALVNRLLFAPQLTPWIAVARGNYDWPIAPQQWAAEDLNALNHALHGKNLTIYNRSEDWSTSAAGLRSLDQQLKQAKSEAVSTGVLVLYFNMPGAVNEDGDACLLPPGSSAADSGSWLNLKEVTTKHLRALELPETCRVLLVLDAARQDVNWKVGEIENLFVAGLETLWRESEMPNLVILNSTARVQRGWTSSELQGSVFSHFLRLGLAGEADVQFGNSDRQVMFTELTRYLDDQVSRWTHYQRGALQRPTIIPSSAADFRVAWALLPATRRRLAAETPQPQPMPVTDADLAALWSARERLLNAKLVSLDAAKWHRLEHDLLQLETRLRGGTAFAERAPSIAADLKRRMAQFEQQIASASRWRVQAGESLWPADSRPHSLTEQLLLSMTDPPEVTRQMSLLRGFAANPSADGLNSTLRAMGSLTQPVAVEAQLLTLLGGARSDAWWSRPGVVGRLQQCQLQASELAAPRDPRTGAWSAPAIAAGDQARRAALDQLMIGNEAAVSAAADELDKASASYAAANAWEALAREAYETLDITLAELPYLAEWMARPQALTAEGTRYDRLINESLLPLIDDARDLEALLAAGEGASAAPPADSALLQARYVELRKRRDELMAVLTEHARNLISASARDGRNVREMDAMLATPLLPAALRDEVWRARKKLCLELFRSFATAGEKDYPTVDAEVYHERVTSRWSRHPLAALWNLTGNQGSSALTPIELGHLARLHLWRLPESARSALASGGDEPAQAEAVQLQPASASVTLRRDRWQRWDHALRAAMPYMIDRNDSQLTTVRRLDLQQQQLWQAERSLDDFYGPAAATQPPFFLTAADDYLANARKLAMPAAAAQREIERLTSLREARALAAQKALNASAADLLVVDPNENIDLTVTVSRDAVAAAGLPVGTPAVWVRDKEGRLPLGAAAEFSTEPVKFTLPAVDLATRGPALDAIVTLRGNERGAVFLLRPPAGVAVDVKTFDYGPPRVVVQGRRRQPASVMFVLDASYSMRDPIPGVESAGQATEIPRMEAAKDALRRMLAQLALAGDARVGLRIFGHRVGWTTTEPSQILPQPTYTRPYAPDLTPAEDVELVLPLGRFDDSISGELDEVLAQVQPWGQSPLYLALRQALDDFTGEDPDAERRIVVITDGANYQFNALTPTTREDILSLAAGRNIPIHIVGFGIPQGEAAAANRDFQTIAEQTGGSYVNVENATSLIASLEQLLGPTEYRITSASGAVFGPKRVGTQIAITPPPTKPSGYTVTAAGARETLELAGGEAVELQLDRGGRDLLVVPYEVEESVATPLVAGAGEQTTGVNFVGHRALRSAEDVRFTFSLQGAERQFVERPGELWIELTPLSADGRRVGDTYYLYDANYLPDTSCPVVSWQALGWPADSRDAKARIWTRTNATSADLVIGDLGDPSHQSGTTHQVPGVNGLSCQLRVRTPRSTNEPTRISLVERHEPGSPGLGALRVQLVPPPASVSHRWDQANNLVVHLFELPPGARSLDDYQLQLTRFEKLSTDATHSREPVTVQIGASDNLLKLSAE